MVEFKIFEKRFDLIKFIVSGVDVLFVNVFRRIIFLEVLIFVVDEVEFLENDFVFFDEIIVYRFVMILFMIFYERFLFDVFEFDDYMVIFLFEVEGFGMVYLGDFKSSDGDVKFVNLNIFIVKFVEG